MLSIKVHLLLVILALSYSKSFAHFESFFGQHQLLDNASNSCLDHYGELSRASSDLVQCIVNNSRPLRYCQNCLAYYAQVKQVYNLITQDPTSYATTLYPDGLTCQSIVESADKVQTVANIYGSVLKIWRDAQCESCFTNYELINGTINFTLTEAIKEFYQKHRLLELCIFNYTQVPITIDPLFQNYSANCTLCNTCKSYYVDVTKFFATMGDETEMCMDVVDQFNYTRNAWSKGFKCKYRNVDEAYVVLISGAFTLSTLLFYIVSYFYYSSK